MFTVEICSCWGVYVCVMLACKIAHCCAALCVAMLERFAQRKKTPNAALALEKKRKANVLEVQTTGRHQ